MPETHSWHNTKALKLSETVDCQSGLVVCNFIDSSSSLFANSSHESDEAQQQSQGHQRKAEQSHGKPLRKKRSRAQRELAQRKYDETIRTQVTTRGDPSFLLGTSNKEERFIVDDDDEDAAAMTQDKLLQIAQLCKAAESGNLEDIDELLRSGTPIDGDPPANQIPLASTAYCRNSSSFWHLLSAGASLQFTCFSGFNVAEAIALAARWSNDEKWKALDVVAVCGVRLFPIHWAAAKGDLQAMMNEVNNGNLLQRDSHDNTVLNYLCACGHLEALQKLQQLVEPSLFSRSNTIGSMPCLLHASENGHLPVVKWLLKETSCKITGRSQNGSSALLFAALDDHVDVVQFLLTEGGASITECNNEGSTALLSACRAGNLSIVKCLVEHDVTCLVDVDKIGCSAAIHAASGGHLDILQYLFQHSISNPTFENSKILEKAASRGHMACVRWLLHKGTAVPQSVPNAFLAAVYRGQLNMAQYLLKKGASITQRNITGITALLFAARGGYLSMVQWLLKEGAQLTEKAENNDALSLAARGGHLDVIRWLVKYRADQVNVSAALLAAACEGQLPIMQWLVDKAGAVASFVTDKGVSALMVASQRGELNIVKWLISRDPVLVRQRDYEGESALFYAIEHSHFEVIVWLVQEAGFSLSEKNHDGWTPFLSAAAFCDVEVLKWMVRAGVNVNVRSSAPGWTPLLVAVHHNKVEAVKWLLLEGGSRITEETAKDTVLSIAAQHDNAHMLICLLVDFDAASPDALGGYMFSKGQCAYLLKNHLLLQAVCLEYDLKQKLTLGRYVVEEMLQNVLPDVLRNLIGDYSDRNADDLSQLHAAILDKDKTLPSAQCELSWLICKQLLDNLFHFIHSQSPCTISRVRASIKRYVTNHCLELPATALNVLEEFLSETSCFL